MSQTRILLVEDDIQIAKALRLNLSLSGYAISIADSASSAREALAKGSFDILLLDVNLPDGNGIEICHELRSIGNELPILFLSANTDEETVVKAMNIGGDDYLRKPFGVEELKARMSKALRKPLPPRKVQSAGPLNLDPGRRQASVNGQPLILSRREFDILSVLVAKDGDVATRDSIISFLEENAEMYDRTIDSHISHLRRKLREAGALNIQIIPVYGIGYKLAWESR